MIVTVFRSRVRPESAEQYFEWAARMSAVAKTMQGYISHKSFTAEDGERVTIVEFRDAESQRRWSTQMDHVDAKKKGRADFYVEYKLQICELMRESVYKASEREGEGSVADAAGNAVRAPGED
jgi:heme-degrading monooxygenase HmoA